MAGPRLPEAGQDCATFQVPLKRFRHPLVGDLTLQYVSLTMPGDPGQILFVYTADPGTAHREALDLLASWTLTGARTPLDSSGCPIERRGLPEVYFEYTIETCQIVGALGPAERKLLAGSGHQTALAAGG